MPDESTGAGPPTDDEGGRSADEPGWAAPGLPPTAPNTGSAPAGDAPPPRDAPPSAAWTSPQATAPAPAPASAWTPPSGTPRPRRRRRWPWLLGLVLGLIVVLTISGVVVWFQKFHPAYNAAQGYMDDITDGDFDGAFDRLCDDSQNDRSASDLEDAMTSEVPILRNGDVVDEVVIADADDFNVNFFVSLDGDEADVDVDLSDRIGDLDRRVTLQLVDEDGEWRPCGGFFGFRTEG